MFDGDGLEGVSLLAVAVAPALVASPHLSVREKEGGREREKQTGLGGQRERDREREVSCPLGATLSPIVHFTRWQACVCVRSRRLGIPVTSYEKRQKKGENN